MQLTEEQQCILTTDSDIKINAVAGAGKTSTLVAYAQSRPVGTPILYLAFNRSVRMEAQRRFSSEGLRNVTVETAHSLAYRRLVIAQKYQVGILSSYDAAKRFFNTENPTVDNIVVTTHVQRFVSYFCNSTAAKVGELDYRSVVHSVEEQDFVSEKYELIFNLTRQYLADMLYRKIPLSHDFYLKLYHLEKPTLNYRYILFDEAQDASPVMAEIVDRQTHAIRVVVGDTHQQIYRWRYAVNAMKSFSYPVYPLSCSFRLSPKIAALSESILRTKRHLMPFDSVRIQGFTPRPKKQKLSAVIGRTNIALLAEAITFISSTRARKIWFEGHINSYLFGEEGGSLSDVLNLAHGKPERIRSPIVLASGTLDALESFSKKTGDQQMMRIIEMVETHGEKLPRLLAKLRKSHVEPEQRHTADMIFSTVHRCKGMEYDTVRLCSDFVSEKALIARKNSDDNKALSVDDLEEEINLLYVAATRAIHRLELPEALYPEGTIIPGGHGKELFLMSDKKETAVDDKWKQNKRKREAAGLSWSHADERYLSQSFFVGLSVDEMAVTLKRSPRAIAARLRKMNFEGSLR